MLLVLTVAQVADAISFVVGIGLHGIWLEANGLAVSLYRLGGLDAVLLAKGAVIVTTLLVLAYNGHRFPRLLTWGSATGTSVGMLGLATNLASLAIIAG